MSITSVLPIVWGLILEKSATLILMFYGSGLDVKKNSFNSRYLTLSKILDFFWADKISSPSQLETPSL